MLLGNVLPSLPSVQIFALAVTLVFGQAAATGRLLS
jgi:hypothetical protein